LGASTPSGFAGRIGREQQVSRSSRKLELYSFRASSQIRDVGVVQASKTRGVDAVHRVRSPNPVFPESRIDRFGDALAPELPFTANVHNWLQGLACAMKREHKPGLGQHAPERGFIKTSARNMQSVLIAFPKKARELVPRPSACLHNGPQDFRSAGFDAAAVGRY
jgi:hypothetical protein